MELYDLIATADMKQQSLGVALVPTARYEECQIASKSGSGSMLVQVAADLRRTEQAGT